MKTTKIIETVKAKKARSYWGKGVQAYAIEMLELVADWNPELTLDNCRNILLNGADDWYHYSVSGTFLACDVDIAERLCSPSELKRITRKDGTVRGDCLSAQGRALCQAYNMIREIIWRDSKKQEAII